MRFYGFGNYYLSSLQQALQAHHACQEIYNKYFLTDPVVVDAPERASYDDWSKNHKTIVLLNGGNSADLLELNEFFKSVEHDYAFASFCEDEQSLCGALTSVGIILTPAIYDWAALDRANRGRIQYTRPDDPSIARPSFSRWEEELIERLNSYALAK